ncbi:MAG: YdeI/OmpD-associated family protein [Gemmatimonadota bacterium]|nr:YdeI/OmpD-associated family protein [Gemmatimonadota bacterium]
MQRFEAVIEEAGGGGAIVPIPFDARDVFGSGRPRVVVTFDGEPYRGSIVSMGGRYLIGIRKDIRAAIDKGPGDTVSVTVELDTAPRVVAIPADLAAALAEAGLRNAFDALSYTHRREHVESIEGAKKAETRSRRIAKTVEMLGD